MPTCPKCGSRVSSSSTSTRTYTILVESERGGESGLVEKKFVTYTCGKCKTRFPVSVARQHYLVVPAETLKRLENEVKILRTHNEMFSDSLRTLTNEQGQLKTSVKSAREEAEVRDLKTRARSLERHVEHLRKDKEELEQKLASGSR